jgi:hypothetical protein
MPVDSHHPEYQTRIEQWTRCRDAHEGGDRIKAKGEGYLPKLSGQTPDEYKAYVQRAEWYGATARTVQALTGAVMRKDPKIVVPDAMTFHLEDITLGGLPLTSFATLLLTETLVAGRAGVLVDLPRTPGGIVYGGVRPYWVRYPAESIVNWRMETREGVPTLTLVVLCENIEELTDDEFVVECATQYRVLVLTPDGRYLVRLYRKDRTTGTYVVIEEIIPTFRGAPLTYIPFCFIGPTDLLPTPAKPPLLDLVDLNLSHYRTSADLEHGRHFCGLPTPWVAGVSKEASLKIGSATAWMFEDANAKAGMLEFSGQGLGALEKGAESKERRMAILGARMLEEQKLGVEAAETLQLRSTGERSALQAQAVMLSLALTRLLRWHAAWLGIKALDTISAGLNMDFMSATMTSTELTALMQAWQSGAISYETFYWNLQRGEIARPGIEVETERELIDNQQPVLMPLTDQTEKENEEEENEETTKKAPAGAEA